MGVLFVLADPRMLEWELSFSKALAAEFAILNNFVWNDVWTFRDLAKKQSGGMARFKRFLKFNMICLAGIGISILLLNLQVRVFHWDTYVANFIAIVLVSFWNFWMNLKFGWNEQRI